MRPGDYVRLAARESRRAGGRVALFVACIAVGVAAVVVVAGLSNGVTDGVRAEGRRLMAADVSVEGNRPIPRELDDLLARFDAGSGAAATPIQRADVREFASVVVVPGAAGASTLAECKVVAGGYPFYGELRLNPDRPLSELVSADAVVVAEELLARLNIKVGEQLSVGGATFRVAGTVVAEPDKLTISFTLGPRVFLSPEGVARTSLLDRGARVQHRALLKLPDNAAADAADRLERLIEAELPGASYYRVRTFSEAQPALRRSFERIGRYLGLVGLLSLLVGGVGVAQVARAWVASRLDDVAVMRCLGATPREVVTLFAAQVIAMAVLASVVGVALGTALQWLVPVMLGDLLPAGLVRVWQPGAVARGLLLGPAVAMLFTLPLLIGLRRVPPVRVLRRDAEPVRDGWLGRAAAVALVLGGVWAAAASQAESARYGAYFAGGLAAAVLVLAAAAIAVSRLARLVPRDAGGLRLRHGLTHLARPGAATVGAVVALGTGVTFVFGTWVVERHLREQLRSELPPDAPSTFLLDVQPDQWEPLATLLRAEGASGVDVRPIVTARFAAVNGVPVDQITRRRAAETQPAAQRGGQQQQQEQRGGGGGGGGGRGRSWALTREQRITYGRTLPLGNRVVAGTFPSGAATGGTSDGGVSVEENFARDLGVSIGSTLTLDVQGVPVELAVTSLRAIDWRTFGINFFLFAEPGPLDDAPQSRIAVARLVGTDLPGVQGRIVRAFPNVTVIHVRDVIEKVGAVLGNMALAVRALGGFTVLAGVVVLGGSVAATQARRAREVALLKAIGMTRRDVAAVFAIEYALTGAVAAVVGLAAGGVLAWAVLTQLMDLPWAFRPAEAAVAVVITVALSVVTGLAASARAMAAKPVEVLRSE